MELAEFEADAERVLDQVVEGRVDIPWLRAEIERLTALLNTLPEQDREAATWTLDELRDYLDTDEAEESQSPDDAAIAQQAKQIRIDVQNSTDTEELERALVRLEQLAEQVGGAFAESVVRNQSELLVLSNRTLQRTTGTPAVDHPSDVI